MLSTRGGLRSCSPGGPRWSSATMSSHVLSEVQQVADRVGIIGQGRLVAVERVETLREQAVRKVELQFQAPVPTEEFAALPGVGDLWVDGTLLRCRLAGGADLLVKAAARHTVVDLLSEEPDLEELFFDYYRNHPEEPSHAA
jgi:ABC-2 type transport system ATP-binding protein